MKPRIRWQYKVILLTESPSIQEHELNKLGEEGWELVKIIYQDVIPNGRKLSLHGNVAYFRREK